MCVISKSCLVVLVVYINSANSLQTKEDLHNVKQVNSLSYKDSNHRFRRSDKWYWWPSFFEHENATLTTQAPINEISETATTTTTTPPIYTSTTDDTTTTIPSSSTERPSRTTFFAATESPNLSPNHLKQHKHRHHHGRNHTNSSSHNINNTRNNNNNNNDDQTHDTHHPNNENTETPYPDTTEEPDVASDTCPTCHKQGVTEDEVKQLRAEMVEDLMMRKLRIDPGDLQYGDTKKEDKMAIPKLPRVIMEKMMKDNSEEEEDEDFYARDQQIVIPGKMNRDCISYNATGCYHFNLSGVKGHVATADLWIYKTKDRNDVHGQTIIVYDLETNSRQVWKKKGMLTTRESIFSKDEWIKLDVTDAAVTWSRRSYSRDVTLAIRCKHCITRHPRALFGAKLGYMPLLIINYADRGSSRRRRSTEDCDPRMECCKRRLDVTFHTVPTLRHIWAPSTLNVGYCYGYCEGITQLTFNHTIVKQQMRLNGNVGASLRTQLTPCCVPLAFERPVSISLLVPDADGTNSNSVIRTQLSNVAVKRCGCV